MGRRNIHATKTGKFMNPTDQARKMARKKELKKNKKQRMVVRQAVLKSKDVFQLLEEAAYYDKQEFDPNVKKTLNDRVIQEKRKKILETVDRLINLYKREDTEYAAKISGAKNEYEVKRSELIIYYEQVKLAESVKASEIPLPDLPPEENLANLAQIPLPPVVPPGFTIPPMFMLAAQQNPQSFQMAITKGILKNAQNLETKTLLSLPRRPPPERAPPGPPPGPIPELSDSEDEERNAMRDTEATRKRLRFADDSEAPADDIAVDGSDPSHTRIRFRRGFQPDGLTKFFDPSFMPNSNFPPLPNVSGPPEPLRFQPSVALRPVLGDSNAVSHFPIQISSNVPLSTIPLPSGPVPHISGSQGMQVPGVILSAPPSLRPPSSKFVAFPSSAMFHGPAGVIEAKPKLKNLIGDATRLVPTSIRVRRSVKDARGNVVVMGGGCTKGKAETSAMYDPSHAARAAQVVTKDSAYEEFMKEIDGLM